MTRGRPAGAPRPRSCSSIASQPRQVTSPGTRVRSHGSIASPLAAGGSLSRPRARSSSNRGDGVGGALLVRADDAGRPALDPADRVLARPGRAVVLADPAAVVADQPTALVERHSRQRTSAVADGADHKPAGDQLVLVGGHRPDASARIRLEPVAHDAQPGHGPVSVAEDLDRRAAEAQLDPVRLPGRSPGRELAQHGDVPPHGGGGVLGLEPRGALWIELELGRVDDDIGARQLAELAQLRVRERGLRRTATAEDDHLGDGGAGERLDRVVGGVGRCELVGVEHQHPRDIDRDVAVADHDGARARQVERLVGVARGGRCTRRRIRWRRPTRAVVARDSQPVVRRRADRVDDRVVALEQVLRRHVGSELDAAEEAEVRMLGRLVVHPRHRLDLRVVGRDAGAHEPVGRRQRVEQVDRDACLQQLVGCVEAGRAGPDHGRASGHGISLIACSGQVPSASSAASTWSAGTSIVWSRIVTYPSSS